MKALVSPSAFFFVYHLCVILTEGRNPLPLFFFGATPQRKIPMSAVFEHAFFGVKHELHEQR